VDPATLDFENGQLRVDFAVGGSTGDRLTIRNQGAGAGEVGVSGNTVSFGGTDVGTFSAGTDGSPLVVTFNANADVTAVKAVMRNVTYENVSNNPSAVPRTVRFALTDGDGGTSTAVTKNVSCASINDPSALDLDGDDSSGAVGADFAATFTEGGGPVAMPTSTPG